MRPKSMDGGIVRAAALRILSKDFKMWRQPLRVVMGLLLGLAACGQSRGGSGTDVVGSGVDSGKLGDGAAANLDGSAYGKPDTLGATGLGKDDAANPGTDSAAEVATGVDALADALDPCLGKSCDDGDPCTADACANGTCLHAPAATGTTCGAGKACVIGLAADPGLVAHWTFDGCDAKDTGPAQLDGVLHGSPACIEGVFGKALLFDGTASYVEVADASLDATETEVTVGAWVREDDTGAYTVALAKEYAWELGHVQGQFATAVAGSKPEQNVLVNWQWHTAGTLSSGTWAHVATVFDGKTVRLYVGGKQVGLFEDAGVIQNVPGHSVSIGARGLGPGMIPAQFWKGAVDEAFFIRRALTAVEIGALAGVLPGGTTAQAWTGGCVALPGCATGTDCDDGDACTSDSCQLASGCLHIAPDCNDGNPCTLDACTAGSCKATPLADGATCSGGTCKAGVCAP